MTLNLIKSGIYSSLLIGAIGAAALFTPASATAEDTASAQVEALADFQVTSASNNLIRSGVKAYNKGNFSKAAALNKAVIRIRPNKSKTAVAQANLCASLGQMGMMVEAEAACDAALKLRPNLESAVANKELLRIKLAQK